MTTYSEVLEAEGALQKAVIDFKCKHKDFLESCIEKAGFNGKLLRFKSSGKVGIIKVEEKSYSSLWDPYEVNFYHITKAGLPSKKSTYVPGIHYCKEDFYDDVVAAFEVAGDFHEG